MPMYDAERVIQNISWPKSQLNDLRLWESNVKFVKTLCRAADSLLDIKSGDVYKDGFPYKYEVGGQVVEFLPHWGGWEVNDQWYSLPKDQTVSGVKDAVWAIAELQNMAS